MSAGVSELLADHAPAQDTDGTQTIEAIGVAYNACLFRLWRDPFAETMGNNGVHNCLPGHVIDVIALQDSGRQFNRDISMMSVLTRCHFVCFSATFQIVHEGC